MIDLARSTLSSGVGLTFETRVSTYDRVFGGLIALLVLGLFLLTVLFSVWWFYLPPVQSTPPAPGDPSVLVNPNEEEELNVVEFDGSENQAFTEVIEMTGASIAELSQSKLPLLNGMSDGISGYDTGPGIGKRRLMPPPAAVAEPTWNVIQTATNLEDYQSKLDFLRLKSALSINPATRSGELPSCQQKKL